MKSDFDTILEIAQELGGKDKAYVQEVEDILDFARVRRYYAENDEDAKARIKTVREETLFNGIYHNVLPWARKFNHSVKELGFDPRLFPVGMLTVAKQYQEKLQGTSLDLPPIEPLKLDSGVEVSLSDLKNSYPRKEVEAYIKYINKQADIGWITITQGGYNVLTKLIENGTKFDKQEMYWIEDLVPRAIVRNYTKKIEREISTLESLRETHADFELQKKIGYKIGSLDHGIRIHKH